MHESRCPRFMTKGRTNGCLLAPVVTPPMSFLCFLDLCGRNALGRAGCNDVSGQDGGRIYSGSSSAWIQQG